MIVVGGVLSLVGLIAKNSSLTPSDFSKDDNLKNYYNVAQTTSHIAMYKSLAFINTMLSAQASAIVAFTLKRTKVCGDPSGTKALINGALAGVVSAASHEY